MRYPFRWTVTARQGARYINVCTRTRRGARKRAREFAAQGYEADIMRYWRGRFGPWVEYVAAEVG